MVFFTCCSSTPLRPFYTVTLRMLLFIAYRYVGGSILTPPTCSIRNLMLLLCKTLSGSVCLSIKNSSFVRLVSLKHVINLSLRSYEVFLSNKMAFWVIISVDLCLLSIACIISSARGTGGPGLVVVCAVSVPCTCLHLCIPLFRGLFLHN